MEYQIYVVKYMDLTVLTTKTVQNHKDFKSVLNSLYIVTLFIITLIRRLLRIYKIRKIVYNVNIP